MENKKEKDFSRIFPMSASEQHQEMISIKQEMLDNWSSKYKQLTNRMTMLEMVLKETSETISRLSPRQEKLEEIVHRIHDLQINNHDILNSSVGHEKQIIEKMNEHKSDFLEQKKNQWDMLNYLKSLMEYQIALYHKGVEFEYYKKQLTSGFLGIPNFAQRMLSLVRGLDKESIATVSLIINRLKVIYELDFPLLNIFSDTEQKEICKLREHFHSSVVQLGEDLFFYQNYLLSINHFEPCVFYYKHSVEYINDLGKLTDKDIIDAGGFIGDSILIFSPLTERKVYSFEPSPQNFEKMKKTVELNGINNAVLEPYALGSEKKKLAFSLNDSSSTAYENEALRYSKKIEVEAISLDEYVLQKNLKVGLIKTDLEGAEQEFLLGAQETIKRDKPVLLISIYHSIDDFLDIKPKIESWNLGYRFKLVKPTDGSIMFETLLIAEVDDM